MSAAQAIKAQLDSTYGMAINLYYTNVKILGDNSC